MKLLNRYARFCVVGGTGMLVDMGMEVNCVAGEFALRQAPVTVFDDETGIGGQSKIARPAGDQLESALWEQSNQRSQTSGADF